MIRHDLADKITIYPGDCMDVLPTLPENSADSLVTDPPAGIAFMGKSWDSHSSYEPRTATGKQTLAGCQTIGLEPWEAGFIAFTADWAIEAVRVLKPGAYGVVWALPRTVDLTLMGLRASGFECRDVITHIFGGGFPKNLDISKAIDKHLGAERLIIGTKEQRNPYITSDGITFRDAPDYDGQEERITAPATEEATTWAGWGTALKPASEHWILVRKPLAEKTVVENVLKHGVGAINIDGCRIPTSGESLAGGHSTGSVAGKHDGWTRPWMNDPEQVALSVERRQEAQIKAEQLGRWPPNLVLTHHAECRPNGQIAVPPKRGGTGKLWSHYRDGTEATAPTEQGSPETVEAWDCHFECPVRLLDEQSGERKAGMAGKRGARNGYNGGWGSYGESWGSYQDAGGASRFFPAFSWEPEDLDTVLFLYCSKAARAERDQGCEHLPKRPLNWSSGEENPGSFQSEGTDKTARNFHPTVKPLRLMRWLTRLCCPPSGIVLDPFNGSGSTGKACTMEGFGYIGIEREPDYVEITLARLKNEQLRFSI